MIFEICGRLLNYLTMKPGMVFSAPYYFQAWFNFEKVYCIVSKVVFWLLNLDSKQHYHDCSTVTKHVISCQNASGKCSRQCRRASQDTCRSGKEGGLEYCAYCSLK